MKKRLCYCAVLVFMICAMFGCGQKNTEIVFDEQALQADAIAVCDALQQGDY